MKRHGGCWSGFGGDTPFRKLPERWESGRTLCPSESTVLGRNSGILLTTVEGRREHRRAMSNGSPDELPLEEIFRHMEETAQHDYPNANRIGCPPDETLEAFARNPRSFPIRDPIFDHVGRCTPCARFIHERRSQK
jgi:hypothetical protein